MKAVCMAEIDRVEGEYLVIYTKDGCCYDVKASDHPSLGAGMQVKITTEDGAVTDMVLCAEQTEEVKERRKSLWNRLTGRK